jgi:hypothetical protein
MVGMSKDSQDEHKLRAALRALRSTLLIAIFTLAAVYFTRRGFYPHGNPLIYAIAISWLIAITVAMPSSVIFLKVNLKLFSPGRLGEGR